MYYKIETQFHLDEILEYLRKSRSDDPNMTVEEVLEKHEHMLNKYAESNFGGRVPEENVFREIHSGEKIKERPEMVRLLAAIESPKIKAIMVVEPQRLSRGDLEDAGRLINLLRYSNTQVITPIRTYDLRDEYDRDAFERELKKGNEYLEYYKKIQANGRLASVEAGNYIGSVPPYGFDRTWIQEGRKKCPILKENKYEADVVRMIYDMYVNQDMGRYLISKKLDELGIKPPKGKNWSPATLQTLLSNVHYIGKVKWNWRKTVLTIENQEIVKSRPVAKVGEYLVYEGKHDAIISEEIFNASLEKMGKNHRTKSAVKIRNPLASLAFCGNCGYAMVMQTFKKNDGSERCKPRLNCNNKMNCPTSSAIFDEVYEKICDVLKQCIEDFKMRLSNDEGNSIQLHSNLIKNLERRKKELEEKELSQWEAQSSPNPEDRMPSHIFKQLNERLLQEKEEIQQALCKAYESMPEPVDYEEKIITFQDVLSAITDDSVDVDLKNIYLKTIIDRIEYKREKPVRITKSNSLDYDIDPSDLKVGGNWYSPPFEIDVKLK